MRMRMKSNNLNIQEKLEIVSKLFDLIHKSTHASDHGTFIRLNTMTAEEFRKQAGLYQYQKREQKVFEEIISESSGAVVVHQMLSGENIERLNSNYKYKKDESHNIYLTIYPELLLKYTDKLKRLISKYGLTKEIVPLLLDPKKGRLSWQGDTSRFCKFEQHGTKANHQLKIINFLLENNGNQYTAKEIAKDINYYEPGGANNISKEIRRINTRVLNDLLLPNEKRFYLIIHSGKYQLNPMFHINQN